MNTTDFLNSISNATDFLYAIVLLIFMILYSIFSLMLYIQINSLLQYIDQISFSPILRFVAVVNLVASLLIIGYTILTISL